MNRKCGLLYDDRLLRHAIAQASPENPDRLLALHAAIQQRFRDDFFVLRPRAADLERVVAVHSTFYLEQIGDHCRKEDPFSYDRDTYLMQESLSTALLAAGGCLEMADNIMAGEFDRGFALVRPPGHHAEPGRGMGFCILNNVGITARYLLDCYRLNRILILDFDAHHGNGTQEMFYDCAEVLFISLHQRDIFPFSGREDETGRGRGEGFNINVPVFPQFGDVEYTFLVGRLLQTVVEQFMPQIILVSAGYDGHRDDTLSGTTLSTEWYGTITTMLKQYADEACDGRLLMILEGGYNPRSLQASVLATLESLRAPDMPKIGVLGTARAANLLINHPLQKYWTLQ